MQNADAGGHGPWYDYRSNIETVNIGEGVTTIGQRAFFNCSSIKTVNLPTSLKTIGSGAFLECSSLKEIKIPDAVTTISDNAFIQCTGLKYIRIPYSVTHIDGSAFSGFTFYDTDGTTELVKTADGLKGYIYEGSGQKLKRTTHLTPPTYTITFETNGGTSSEGTPCGPETVTAGQSIQLPTMTKDGNVFIGWFTSASEGTKVTSPYTPTESTTLYAHWASNKCGENLTWTLNAEQKTLTITGTGSMYDYDADGTSPWYGVEESIESVIIETGVTTIGYCAFYQCKKLESIDIPDTVGSIGGYAFSSCISLTSIKIPDSVETIQKGTFYSCTSLRTVILGENSNLESIGVNAFWKCSLLASIRIPNTVTSIGDVAFANCEGLKELAIGNSVTSIGTSAFHGLTFRNSAGEQLEVTVANMAGYEFNGIGNKTLTRNDCGYGVTYTLDADGKLTISKTGDGSGEMYDYDNNENKSPWNGNTSIKKVIIGRNVTTIGAYAFRTCTSLTSIEISDTVGSIGWGAFYGCTGLTGVTIPGSVTSIGNSVFYKCESLSDITIPNSVTSIGSSAFQDCTSLTTVTIGENSSLGSIGANAFFRCNVLASIRIPNSVTEIGMSAFASCTGLTELIIGNSVTSIGNSAFYGLTFYDSDGTTVLEQTVANLKGCTFTGDGDGRLKKTSSPTYTITFVTDGTSCEAKSVTAGQRIGTLPTTTKDGYTFNGWFTSASGGTKVTSTYEPTGDTTLYAQWTADTGSKTKGLDTNGQFLLVTFSAIITLTALALIITRKRP